MRHVVDLRVDSLTGSEDGLRAQGDYRFFQATVPTRDRPFSLLWVRREGPGDVGGHLEGLAVLRAVTRLRGHGEWGLFELDWAPDQPAVVPPIEAVGGHVLRAVERDDGWQLGVGFPDEASLDEALRSLEAAGVGVESTRQRHASTPDPPTEGLTPTQRRTLDAALREGYFEVPREVTLGELAAELGITDQAVSARLRRGLGKLVARELAHTGSAADG